MTGRKHYPELRRALAPEYAELSDEGLEQIVPQLFGPGIEAADAEDFFGSLARGVGRIGRTIAQNPMVGRVAGGAAQGALGGAALGPWGALGGAVLGGLGGALTPGRSAAPQQRPSPAPVPQGAASAQLITLLARPELLQALSQMVLGRAGGSAVPVGPRRTPVPAGAFTNLLAALATQATEEFAETHVDQEADESYLAADPNADPTNPHERARALWTFLATQPPVPAKALSQPGTRPHWTGETNEFAESANDELEAAAWLELAAVMQQ